MADRTYTRTFTAAEWRALENDLSDPFSWVDIAINNKIAACQGRMATEAVTVLTADPAVTEMPAKTDRLIAGLVKRPDYKNRAARDAAEVAATRARAKE